MNKIKFLLLGVFCVGINSVIFSQIQRNTTYNIQSKSFNDKREFQVHLPKNIEEAEYLPLIFVFDAQWDTYYNFVTSTIDYLTEVKEFPKSIVIGINNKERQYELTPVPVNEDWRVPSLGGATFLEKHLINEVIPFIEKKYKVANFRIGIGHSLGGTFVLNSLVDKSNLFNVYIAISPNLQLDDEEIVLKIKRNISKVESLNKLFFVTIGTSGNPDTLFLPPVKKLDSIVKTHSTPNFNWNFRVLNNYNHGTTPLASIQASLLFLAKKWKISKAKKEKIVQSKDVLSEFKLFYTELSKWAGYKIKPEKHDYYNVIRTLEKNKQYRDAITLYQDAIKNYPSHSMFYNGVAENLIKMGNKTKAKEYLKLALKILDTESFNYSNDKNYFRKIYLNNLNKVNKEKHLGEK